MQGGGVILPHHMVAEVDETQTDQFRDIQHFHVTETGEGPANAGKQCPNGDEDVAEETGPSFVLCEILDGRVNGAAKEKDEGVEVEERRKRPDPLPLEHSAGEALIEALRSLNRREQYTNSADDDG